MIHTEMESLLTREAPKSSNSTLFDDYGRSISLSSGRDSSLLRSSELSPRLMCRKIGLDGLRMLDPSTSRTLRIYTLRDANYTTNTPLDTVTAAMFQVPDEAVSKCTLCGSDFGAFNLRHHCRNCGDVFCDKCTQGRIALSLSLQRRMLPKSVSSTGAW
ncbi:unnamed protein product, partial [Brassica oleracea]